MSDEAKAWMRYAKENLQVAEMILAVAENAVEG